MIRVMAESVRPLRYHLRFQVIPGPRCGRVARELAAFCLRHGVEETVLFYNAEEWNNGHPTAIEEDSWMDALREAKEILEERGIVVSLNPWITVLHTDRGRRLKEGQAFSTMVSPLGEKSAACASFADPAWRAYVKRQWARFAVLGFRLIWVEDDFRYHNHAPLTWGGGFEDPVIGRFAAKIGRPTTREEVVSNILRPGEPHPWRALWMETWRDLQLETAKDLSAAVGKSSGGKTALGLMSSLPSVHAAEGRDWGRLFQALSVRGRVAHRPHFAPYGDVPGKSLSNAMLLLDLQRTLRKDPCECAPEIENFPFTDWNKSDAQTWAEMAVALFQGSDALLLDLFPFSGNGPRSHPAVGRLLDGARPALEWIAARFPGGLETQGVGIPWREDAQERVRTVRGATPAELDATSLAAGRFLMAYGIPATARPGRAVNAVFGSLAWAFPDDEVSAMLAGGLLLDGEAASILCERGFSDLIGVKARARLAREESNYAVETAATAESGMPRGFHCSVNNLPWIAALRTLPGARAWTRIVTPEGRRIGAGVAVFSNRLGGRVVCMAAPDPAVLAASDQRRSLAHRMADFLAVGSPPLLVGGGPHQLPMQFRDPATQRKIVVVCNGSADPRRPEVLLAGGGGEVRATLLAPMGRPRACAVRLKEKAGRLAVAPRSPVPYLGFLVVEREG